MWEMIHTVLFQRPTTCIITSLNELLMYNQLTLRLSSHLRSVNLLKQNVLALLNFILFLPSFWSTLIMACYTQKQTSQPPILVHTQCIYAYAYMLTPMHVFEGFLSNDLVNSMPTSLSKSSYDIHLMSWSLIIIFNYENMHTDQIFISSHHSIAY